MSKGFDKTFQRNMLCGRLAKDPEITFIPSGKAVCNFGLVISNQFGGSDYVPCVAWEAQAKAIGDNLVKGSLLLVEGRIKSSTYDDGEGRKQFKLQFELSGTPIFLDTKRSGPPESDGGLAELPEIGEDV